MENELVSWKISRDSGVESRLMLPADGGDAGLQQIVLRQVGDTLLREHDVGLHGDYLFAHTLNMLFFQLE